MKEFSDRTYLVTGATQGIGAVVSHQLAENGARLFLIARNAERLGEFARLLPNGPHDCLPFDVCDVSLIDEKISGLKKAHPCIDGMVYCVGVGKTARLRDLTPQDMDYAFRGNCAAYVEFIRCLARKKPKQQKLRVVGISSLASIDNEKYLTAYAAGKAAMDAATRCLANELCGRNIRVNVIRPGFVDTPRLSVINDLSNGIGEQIIQNGYQPLGLIPAQDVASMVLYLLSDKGDFINGCCIPVNGGALS